MHGTKEIILAHITLAEMKMVWVELLIIVTTLPLHAGKQ